MNATKSVWDGVNVLEIDVTTLEIAELFLVYQLQGAVPGATIEQVTKMKEIQLGFTRAQQLALAMDGLASFVERGLAEWISSQDAEGNPEFVVHKQRFKIYYPMRTLAEARAIEQLNLDARH